MHCCSPGCGMICDCFFGVLHGFTEHNTTTTTTACNRREVVITAAAAAAAPNLLLLPLCAKFDAHFEVVGLVLNANISITQQARASAATPETPQQENQRIVLSYGFRVFWNFCFSVRRGSGNASSARFWICPKMIRSR